ncbi:uncharacterized protein LOC131013913 [Salvia miltiorrhiza]|uniref:uncharacterized protein LOC131013913 n=1 Tax=Salvia miltiorrhiza TaxID=226208 RepID=UPI0025ACAB0C|nr:uncharacterized protein LOC131013913 [Salvia miltiorrhiza]
MEGRTSTAGTKKENGELSSSCLHRKEGLTARWGRRRRSGQGELAQPHQGPEQQLPGDELRLVRSSSVQGQQRRGERRRPSYSSRRRRESPEAADADQIRAEQGLECSNRGRSTAASFPFLKSRARRQSGIYEDGRRTALLPGGDRPSDSRWRCDIGDDFLRFRARLGSADGPKEQKENGAGVRRVNRRRRPKQATAERPEKEGRSSADFEEEGREAPAAVGCGGGRVRGRLEGRTSTAGTKKENGELSSSCLHRKEGLTARWGRRRRSGQGELAQPHQGPEQQLPGDELRLVRSSSVQGQQRRGERRRPSYSSRRRRESPEAADADQIRAEQGLECSNRGRSTAASFPFLKSRARRQSGIYEDGRRTALLPGGDRPSDSRWRCDIGDDFLRFRARLGSADGPKEQKENGAGVRRVNRRRRPKQATAERPEKEGRSSADFEEEGREAPAAVGCGGGRVRGRLEGRTSTAGTKKENGELSSSCLHRKEGLTARWGRRRRSGQGELAQPHQGPEQQLPGDELRLVRSSSVQGQQRRGERRRPSYSSRRRRESPEAADADQIRAEQGLECSNRGRSTAASFPFLKSRARRQSGIYEDGRRTALLPGGDRPSDSRWRCDIGDDFLRFRARLGSADGPKEQKENGAGVRRVNRRRRPKQATAERPEKEGRSSADFEEEGREAPAAVGCGGGRVRGRLEVRG